MYEIKRSYAPEVVANHFFSKPFHFMTAKEVSLATEIPRQNVQVIIRRLVDEGVLVRCIARFGREQRYYFIGH
jgi:predicted transcriptional regulator